jgi:hypothetical protein
MGKKIIKIEITSDTITSRGGLSIFNRYLENIGILDILQDSFGHYRKSSKGLSILLIFKQIFCFLFDGTSRHISHFDHLKSDEGYTAAIELDSTEMASTPIIKRFFYAFGVFCIKSFRAILHKLFVWRLHIIQPDVIELYIDTMVMDNDDASKRHGVQPTYKKVKGFQPLQVIWAGKIIDAIFRGGKKNGNSGNTVVNVVTKIVNLIRKQYRSDVMIVLRCDAGFFDKVNFKAFNDMNIAFIATGKQYDEVKKYAKSTDKKFWKSIKKRKQTWNYTEFGFRCSSWNFFLRAVYTHLENKGNQLLLEFARPDNVILTNIGINDEVLKYCPDSEKEYWLNIENIIGAHHSNGADELAHRGFKDFGFEQLPFKKFGPNAAFYYCMVIAFFLFETFKEDALSEVISINSYASTVRRKLVDFAAKIVKTGNQIILKISRAIMETYQIQKVWQRCHILVPIPVR